MLVTPVRETNQALAGKKDGGAQNDGEHEFTWLQNFDDDALVVQSVDSLVHFGVFASADLLGKRTSEFGETVEWLLQKHGKKIVDEQMQLKRIADASIYLFAFNNTKRKFYLLKNIF